MSKIATSEGSVTDMLWWQRGGYVWRPTWQCHTAASEIHSVAVVEECLKVDLKNTDARQAYSVRREEYLNKCKTVYVFMEYLVADNNTALSLFLNSGWSFNNNNNKSVLSSNSLLCSLLRWTADSSMVMSFDAFWKKTRQTHNKLYLTSISLCVRCIYTSADSHQPYSAFLSSSCVLTFTHTLSLSLCLSVWCLVTSPFLWLSSVLALSVHMADRQIDGWHCW